MKAYILVKIISYTVGLKKNSRLEQRTLELELHELQAKYNLPPSEELGNEILLIKTDLEILQTRTAEKSLFFMSVRMYEFANKPTHYLANLLQNYDEASYSCY